jgi:phage terminase small subunit
MTPRQQRFIEEYLRDLNATQAAVRAGYAQRSAERQALRMLAQPEIADAVRQAKAQRAKETGLSAAQAIVEASALAFSDIGAIAEWGPDGVRLKPSSELSEAARRSIAEIVETQTERGRNLRVKLHDKRGAIELLCRHLGVFDRPVRLALPPMNGPADAAKAMATVVAAAAAGEITPAEGAAISNLVDAYRRAIETSELASEVARLRDIIEAAHGDIRA